MEWDRCHSLIMTRHSLDRLPSIQIAERLSPIYIYIYIEREREREKCMCARASTACMNFKNLNP